MCKITANFCMCKLFISAHILITLNILKVGYNRTICNEVVSVAHSKADVNLKLNRTFLAKFHFYIAEASEVKN